MKGPPRRGERGGFFYFRTVGVAFSGHPLLVSPSRRVAWDATPTIERGFSAPCELGDADRQRAHQLLSPLPRP